MAEYQSSLWKELCSTEIREEGKRVSDEITAVSVTLLGDLPKENKTVLNISPMQGGRPDSVVLITCRIFVTATLEFPYKILILFFCQ